MSMLPFLSQANQMDIDFRKRLQEICEKQKTVDRCYTNLSTQAAVRSLNSKRTIRERSLESEYKQQPIQKPYSLLKKPPKNYLNKQKNEDSLFVIKKYVITASSNPTRTQSARKVENERYSIKHRITPTPDSTR